MMNRRGVTPLVTLRNRSGHNALKSLSTSRRSSSLCSAATPLDRVAADAGEMRHPHRPIARLVDQRACARGRRRPDGATSPSRRLISYTISRWRGRTLPNRPTGPFLQRLRSRV